MECTGCCTSVFALMLLPNIPTHIAGAGQLTGRQHYTQGCFPHGGLCAGNCRPSGVTDPKQISSDAVGCVQNEPNKRCGSARAPYNADIVYGQSSRGVSTQEAENMLRSMSSQVLRGPTTCAAACHVGAMRCRNPPQADRRAPGVMVAAAGPAAAARAPSARLLHARLVACAAAAAPGDGGESLRPHALSGAGCSCAGAA
jgi:hypothetical protein